MLFIKCPSNVLMEFNIVVLFLYCFFQLLGPIVVSILQEAMNGCPTSVTEITPGLLLKDAAYSAAGYVYYELSNYLSFNNWYVPCSNAISGICQSLHYVQNGQMWLVMSPILLSVIVFVTYKYSSWWISCQV